MVEMCYVLNCSDSVVCFELFWQCGMFWIVPTVWYVLNCSDSVVCFELFWQCGMFWIVPTVWYVWNCSDSVVCFELFWQCGMFWIVLTVWYVLFFIVFLHEKRYSCHMHGFWELYSRYKHFRSTWCSFRYLLFYFYFFSCFSSSV